MLNRGARLRELLFHETRAVCAVEFVSGVQYLYDFEAEFDQYVESA